ncbi:hypothetical protein BJQ94_11305 [Cryobacterium sp. SO2]|uniref:hypothetical protein n=1 Tax=Cryobacterium sp. SO2 TaxID=1897060 RepID=UPI00223CA762|nr:hypothetical protein [Cryobacterium sp. SO2]WEO75963.1 hypothetical protein BJQ94_11305 [Cryobacterium sp. SO2]
MTGDGIGYVKRVLPVYAAGQGQLNHRRVIVIPDSPSFTDAAALPTALFTEHGAVTTAGIASGATVLFTEATSAIGLIGVQIAKVLG